MAEPIHYEIGSSAGFAEAERRIAEAAATRAETLDLGGLGLVELPKEWPDLPDVKTLFLGYPEAVTEKPSYERSKEGKKLCNAVKTLPAALFKAFPHLETLHLDDNQLTALPGEIGGLQALQRLSLDNNQLTALPGEIGGLQALQELNLRDNQLTALPGEIGGLQALQELNLRDNQLTALPGEIGGLQALQRLSLDNNQLTALPGEIGGLQALQGLWLDNNRLTALAGEIGGLHALRVLRLNNNQLTALAGEIGGLQALLTLRLRDNQLTALPGEIGGLQALQRLSLDNNQLTALPGEIGGLQALQQLNLRDNQLTALPGEIGGLQALEELSLSGNQLPESIVKAFADGGIAALAGLLRGLEDEAAPLFECKLLVTGEGGVGKSWALAALHGDDPSDAVGDQTTYGIDRGTLPLPHPEKPGATITLNTWDFGGQQVYRVTHQFFFSEEAVFLLVWNPRMGAEQCQVRQWLRRIELRTGGDAKVIMVASHCPADQTPYRPDYGHDSLPEDLRSMIVDEIAIDSEPKPGGGEGDNIQALRDLIAKHAADLPRMGDPFPRSWEAARNATVALVAKHPYIHYGRFANICEENGITDPDQTYTLARVFMHGLGRAVYYGERRDAEAHDGQSTGSGLPEFQDALLADIMVLDAEWLSKAFVQVLEDEATNQAGGMLDHGLLDVIWRTHDREDWTVYQPTEHEFLIRLMRVFDVSYVVKGTEGRRSLVAQLVPERRPELPWVDPPVDGDAETIRLQCNLENEADGLLPRYTVHTEPYHVLDDDSRGLFWTEGVFLREKTYGNEALVTVDGTERPVVTILVNGKQPGWFVSELYRALDSLLGFWPGLKKTYKVLCPTVRDDGQLCTGSFEFDFLVAEDKEHPDENQVCQTCRERRTPRELLFGFGGIQQQREPELRELLEYMVAPRQAPCPRLFTLTPVNGHWADPRTHMPSIAGRRLRITLLSEFSAKPVVSEEFTIKPEWVKWLGPVARLTALALSGIAVPLTGDAEKELAEAATFMTNIGGMPLPEGREFDDERTHGVEATWVSGADAETLHGFLKEIGLAPGFGGMKFAKIRQKRYMWVTAEEAAAHAEETPKLVYDPPASTTPSGS